MSEQAGPSLAAIGDFVADRDRNLLRGPTGEVSLEPKVMDLLFALAAQPGQVVPRAELIQRVWGVRYGGDESLSRAVSILRKAFGEAGRDYLETVSKRGYCLNAAVSPVGPPPAAGGPSEARGSHEGPAPSTLRRLMGRASPPVLVSLGVLVALVVIALGSLALPQRSQRVAVLPFDTLGDGRLRPFADGLADQIIGAMSANELPAVPRLETTAFRGRGLVPAARDARVGVVLDGVVRQESETLRVSMHLIDPRASVTLWSSEYQRGADEAAFLQAQIAADATGVLRCAALSQRRGGRAVDPAALAIFLRACDRARTINSRPEETLEAARRVTELAPRFSRGWSMLAMASAIAGRGMPPQRAAELGDLARRASAQALELDPANGEAHLALAALEPPIGRWAERQALIDRALALDPNSADALAFQADLLLDLGRLSEARASLRRAVAIDPLSPQIAAAMIPVLAAAGDVAEAGEVAERLHQVWPNSPAAAVHRFKRYAFIGDPDEALARLPPVFPLEVQAIWRDFLLAKRSGDPALTGAAGARIDAAVRAGRFDTAAGIAMLSSLGEVDRAYALADEFFQEPTAITAFLFLASTEAMRRDPRFLPLVRRIGLVDYWAETGRWPDFCSAPDLPYRCPGARTRPSPPLKRLPFGAA